MNIQTAQLGGMLRNELRMQWRRGSLRTLVFMLAVTPIAFSLMLVQLPDDMRAAIGAGRVSAEQLQVFRTGSALITVSFVALVLGMMLTVIVADTIAIDRHYGMSEMLGSLPLTPGAYLAGKLFSVWGPLLALLIASGILTGAVVWLSQGSFEVGQIVGFWLATMLPFGLFASALSMLWAARQPTRRRAALVGFALVPICSAVSMALVLEIMIVVSVRTTVALSTLELSAAPDYPDLLAPAHLAKLAAMLGSVALSWLFVWWRMQKQEQI